MASEKHTNRLAREMSPYLLQHAHNPVDWFAWGEEAFAEARRRDVPIFLSVGYSTCYWCHVMERESFESAAIAEIMNRHFVNVKVDREERPDVDDIYMMATQIISGRGGWPMSCFLEPGTLRPFWCATYFPPEPRMGMPGFGEVLESLSEAWRTRREEVVQQSAKVAEVVREHLSNGEAPAALGVGHVGGAAQALLKMLDRTWGGFGGAPKFPQPANLEFLLDVRASAGDAATRAAVDEALRLTLDKMAIGGMRDQVGGGFHRYSVDAMWTVPHFEKMLYDNAQLARVYARAAAMYGDDFYRQIAISTIGWVKHEMTGEHGAFFSAQDAEVDGREGANYVWTAEEVGGVLGGGRDGEKRDGETRDGEMEKGKEGDAAFALKVYELERGPNFRDPHHADAAPVNVLRMENRPEKVAAELGMGVEAFRERLGRINCTLYGVRAKRQQPRLDDKVLASWNGMMIQALADAARLLGTGEPVEMAGRAAAFVAENMKGGGQGGGGLLRSWRGGSASTPGFLEDYACVIAGLVALAQHGGEEAAAHRERAAGLAREAEALFGDEASGGYFDARAEQAELFIRPRSLHDGAIPSGSSLMLHALLDLHDLTGEAKYLERAMRCLASMSGAVARSPGSTINATRAILRLLALGKGEAMAQLGAPVVEEEDSAAADEFTPVEVYSETDRIEIAPDSPAQFRVVLRIAEGYHITAADPGPGGAGLVPLRVHVIGGEGIAAYADYPAGELWEGAPGAGGGGEVRVYRGEVEFVIAVEREGAWKGRPLLAMTMQACTERECLRPVTVELDVAVDRGG
jgi:uncharacterized protein